MENTEVAEKPEKVSESSYDEDTEDWFANSDDEELEEFLNEDSSEREEYLSVQQLDESGELNSEGSSESQQEINKENETTPSKSKLPPVSHLQAKAKSYLNSSPRKIVKKYKRQAAAKSFSNSKRFRTGEVAVIEEKTFKDPLQVQPETIDMKLGKCGTTLKKILVTDEPTIKVISTMDATESKSLPVDDESKLMKIVSTENILANPVKIASKLPKVILKKNPKGTYSFVTDCRNLPPESFPKAIVYSQYEKQKLMNQKMPTPSTSKERPKATFVPPVTASYIESRSLNRSGSAKTDSIPMNVEDLFVIEDYDQNMPESAPESEPKPETPLKKIPENLIRLVKFPAPPKPVEPEPVQYVIPQNMLMDPNDRLKVIDESSSSSSEVSENDENGDLFVIDRRPSPPTSPKLRSRRKEVLVPRATGDEAILDDPFRMSSRPQANLDLIENLAKYRVLVRNMLEKLDIPQIDFNDAEGDEYLNMYKIFRS